MERRLKRIKAKFKYCPRFAIIGHKEPDGDAIFSALALKRWIEVNYPKASVNLFFDSNTKDSEGKPLLPELYKPYFPQEYFKDLNSFLNRDYKVVIVLDSPKKSRLGQYASILKTNKWVLNIDHHEDNDNFGSVNFVLPKASSTGEIIWFFLRALAGGMRTPLYKVFDSEMLKYIYIATLTDTACFTSPTTTSRTHRMIFELQTQHVMVDDIRRYFFAENSKARTYLMAKALQSLKYYKNDTITVMRLNVLDFKECNGQFSDTYGIVNQGINITGVYISAMFIETEENMWHVSLRTKDENIRANDIAKLFGGGGHQTMAAFQHKIEGNIDDFIDEFVSKSYRVIENDINKANQEKEQNEVTEDKDNQENKDEKPE